MKDRLVVIGLDVGSSAIKIIAAETDGEAILFRERREYGVYRGEAPAPVSIYCDMAAEILGGGFGWVPRKGSRRDYPDVLHSGRRGNADYMAAEQLLAGQP